MKAMILPAALLVASLSMMAQSNNTVVHQNGLFAQAFAVIEGTSVSVNVSRGTNTSGQPHIPVF